MPIYLSKLQTKLDAIINKNLDIIMANNPSLPFIGTGYTRATLQAWLDKRSSLLTQIKTAMPNNTKITQAKNAILNSMTVADRLKANKFLANDETWHDTSWSGVDGYEKFSLLVLYKLVTNP